MRVLAFSFPEFLLVEVIFAFVLVVALVEFVFVHDNDMACNKCKSIVVVLVLILP